MTTTANSFIPVTQPYMPPLEEFIPYLQKIWESKWLTNAGAFHQQLELELAKFLGVEYISLFCNGTIALISAMQGLRISGEVITTPYSFVATAHSLLWNGLKPVFVDIKPDTFGMDPEQIVSAITPLTTAILPVHCYGYPCDVERIQKIADVYGLRVIYDAAHAFGVQVNGKPILTHGDMSILSFHATKVFNTFEGGAIVCPDHKMKQRIDYLKNFGFADETTVVAPGINGKMNEIQAAFGIIQLKHLASALDLRAEVDNRYRNGLNDVKGIDLCRPPSATKNNFSYFPILVNDDYPSTRDELYQRLKQAGILSRRYFYPLISDMPMYRAMPSANPACLPVASRISKQILCLPIYPALLPETQNKIIEIIREI